MSTLTRARRLLIVGPAVLALLLAACGSESEDAETSASTTTADDTESSASTPTSDDPLRVGLLFPLTGVFAPVGQDFSNGWNHYLEQNDGKLGGREVEVVTEDEAASPQVATEKARKLLDSDKVDVVVGVTNSASALALRDMFHEAEVPFVITGAGADDLTGSQSSPYLFRTAYSNQQTAVGAAEWMAEEFGSEPVALLASDFAASHEIMGSFERTLTEAGGTVSETILTPFQQTQDYQPFISQVQQSDAGAAFAFYAGAEGVAFVKQYEQFGAGDDVTLVAHGATVDETILPALGDAALGLRSVYHYAATVDNDLNREFVSSYRDAYDKDPSAFALHTYDAAALLDAAVSTIDGDIDPSALAEALDAVEEIDSPRGPLSFDANHNPVQHYYLREVQSVEGELKNVVLEDLGSFSDPE